MLFDRGDSLLKIISQCSVLSAVIEGYTNALGTQKMQE